ncbi:MAG: NADH-quinone oxidoreductase subunit J family protein [Thermogutta sp.]
MMGLDAMAIFFWLFAVVTCAGALIVVFSRNIVRAAMGLLVSLFGVAMLFFLAGAEFLGAMQLMIYVGGTVVLLAFGVMLTARPLFLRMTTTADQRLMAILLASPLTVILLQAALSYAPPQQPCARIDQSLEEPPVAPQISVGRETSAATKSSAAASRSVTVTQLGMALLGFGDRDERLESTTIPHGNQGYLLPFELISVHLLVVLIGAAYLARRGTPKTMTSGLSVTPYQQIDSPH